MILLSEVSIDPFLQYGSFGLLAFIVFWAIWKFLPNATDRHFAAIDRLATEHSTVMKAMLATFEQESNECRNERMKDREAAVAERLRDQQARHEMMNRVTASQAEVTLMVRESQRSVVELQKSVADLQRLIVELQKGVK